MHSELNVEDIPHGYHPLSLFSLPYNKPIETALIKGHICWRFVGATIDSVEGVQTTLNERGSQYGDLKVLMELSQELQDVMKSRKGWSLLVPHQREALQMIASKIARILNGDPNYADNWHDIQGYARLVEERLPKQEE